MSCVISRKKARIEKEAVQIPEDVTVEILKSLPVKSLLRLKGVCQTWHALISGPEFCYKLHQKRSCVVICRKRQSTFSTISVESLLMKGKNSVQPTVSLSLPWEHGPVCTSSRFLGSCNGLVCVYQSSPLLDGSGDLILWNPSTRKFMKLPPTGRVPFNGYSRGRPSGFGYVASGDDYKLVWMACRGKRRVIEFDVFSLKSKTWRSFDHSQPPDIILSSILEGRQFSGAFSDGAIHWIVRRKDRAASKSILILALHLASSDDDNKYKLLEPPKGCGLGSKVVSLSGCLCLYTHGGSSTDLWMMKEYGVYSSWIKLVSFPTISSFRGSSMFLWTDHPIHFLNEEGSIVATYSSNNRSEIMRLQVEKGAIVSYETLSSVSVRDFTFVLEESLVSLN